MRLVVNGDARDVHDDATLLNLLASLDLKPGTVVVEHNGTALLRSELAGIALADGDRVELIRAVAGG